MTEVVELYVVMHCEACAAAVKRAIRKIPGVESYKLDFYGQKVTVIGNVDREDVWRRIQKSGKRATLIPKPDPPKKEKKEEKKEDQKEEKKEEKKKEEAKKEEKTEEKQEAKKEKPTLVRKKSSYWPTVRLWRFLTPREVKIHEKEEVVKLVEATDEKQQEGDAKAGDSEKGEEGEEKKEKKKTKKAKEPEWVPLLVTAPFYTLGPTSVY